ncbi:MAG: ketoacyl-ACP synthase III [Syntrophales bacterium]|jgi:3-oxoacyl-[acyl-carrier-protein] synthase-3|nr:ketoacyl-ACP synthase III [Syntrophales bacterium]MCK9528771.1 ketoacyl-ACP synthase III [Syntrophales bacterium]MDX9922489.1 ketoacyl-ACP synthase III [Syntrophales bacterium]
MVYIHGIGHFHPENVITNQFLADLDIGCSEEWIMERLGIRERRTILDLDYIRTTKNRDLRQCGEASVHSHGELGALAADMAIERAGIGVEDIGFVVCGSSAPGHLSPAEASCVAAELGLSVPCLDLNSSCSSFGAQMFMLSSMNRDALPPFVLVVNPETITQMLDYSDRRSVPIFGDCGTAAVVSLTEPSRLRIENCRMNSNPHGWDKVVIPRMSHFSQDGNAVQGFAIRKATEGLRRLQAEYADVPLDRFKFIGHQANLGMLKTVIERAGVDESNHWFNVIDYGNAGCASAPSVLSQNWDRLEPGDHIAVVLVGSGLTWASMMVTCDADHDQRGLDTL